MKDYRFSALSHELRTPLCTIVGFSELLLAEQRPLDVQREFIEIIHTQGVRLSKLVDNLLELEHIESGDRRPILRPVRLGEIVEQACAFFGQDDRLTVVGADRPLVVDVDPELIARALSNLISNALTFSPVLEHVVVRVVGNATSARCEVIDHGPGVPAEQHDRVFDRFFRTEIARESTPEGSGLGLTLVREIVVRQGGQVHVQATEGGGSTFTIELPLSTGHEDGGS